MRNGDAGRCLQADVFARLVRRRLFQMCATSGFGLERVAPKECPENSTYSITFLLVIVVEY